VILDPHCAELISSDIFDPRRADPVRAIFDLCHPFAMITSTFRTTRANVAVILDHGEKRNDILST